jgi:hypothetical protein
MPSDNDTTDLRLNDEGEKVTLLQSLLQKMYPDLVVDGKYGPDTLSAVRKFQDKERLPQSSSEGAVDVCTWNALQNSEAYPPVHHIVPLIPQPDRGTCWAACAAALTNKTVEEVVASTPPELIYRGGIRNYSGVDDWRPLEDFAKSQGLQMFPPQSWVLEAFRNQIAEGPIMVNMLTDADRYVEHIPSNGHFVVIVGIRGDSDPSGKGTALSIQDPLPPGVGKRYSVNFFDWINKQLARTYNVFQARK